MVAGIAKNKKQRHRQTATEFNKWLKAHPSASRRKQISTFDSIADKYYFGERAVKAARVSKKIINRI